MAFGEQKSARQRRRKAVNFLICKVFMPGMIEPSTEATNIQVEINGAAAIGDSGLVLSNDLLSKIGVSSKVPPKVIVDGDRIVVVNSVRYAIEKCRKAMKGEAERLGLKTEEDVYEMCSQLRHGGSLRESN